MKSKFTVKKVVATAIGSALFFVLARFVAIPTGVPNTNISLQYAIQGVFAVMFGVVPGALIGFIGHALTDLSYGSPWWSWVIASGVAGAVIGVCDGKIHLWDGQFGKSEIKRFVIMAFIAHAVSWVIVAPVLDIVIYSEPVNLVFTQGIVAAIANFLTTTIIGGLLLAAYTKTLGKTSSLDKNN